MTEKKPQGQSPEEMARKNMKMFLSVLGVVSLMIGLTFASAPLYDLFCRVTGYGGTTQRVAERPQTAVLEREITVRFDANISRRLNWKFSPTEHSVRVNIGADGLTHYTAENPTEERLAGVAMYNVSPAKAGKYFNKVECFCFLGQILESGEKNEMMVSFYIDPALADDPYMEDVDTITLSYTYFPADPDNLEEERERFSDKDGRMKTLDESKVKNRI